MSQPPFKFNKITFIVPITAIVIIWFVYCIELFFGLKFNNYGIYPKTFIGLRGVFLSPFIHGNLKHIFNNSVPLFVMLSSLYYFYHSIANKVLVYGFILTGLLTWSFARPANHIGASGIVYFLVSFVFFSGIFRKYYRLVALSLVVVFLYGGLVWYILPSEEGISWEGHLSGFLIGFLFSLKYKNEGPQPEKFTYTKNEEFESYFDEDGNFNPPMETPETTEEL